MSNSPTVPSCPLFVDWNKWNHAPMVSYNMMPMRRKEPNSVVLESSLSQKVGCLTGLAGFALSVWSSLDCDGRG
jgi:hypothetical protein